MTIHKKTFSRLVWPCFSLILAACSHNVIMPGSLRQKPEVAGRWGGGEVAYGVHRNVEVEVFNDITANPPTRTDGSTLSFIQLVFPVLPYFDVGLGLFERLDVYYNSGLGLRYMWLGDSKSEGWKSTVFGGVISGGSSTENEGATKAETILSGMEYGFSVGQNFGKSNLVYITLGQQKGDGKSTITQTAQTFKYSDDFEHTLLSLGATTGEQWYFWAEISGTETKWKTSDAGTNTETNTGYMLGGGYRW